MANVLLAQTQAAGSPMSGAESPSMMSDGGDKPTRTQSKKILSAEVELLVNAFDAYKTISKMLAKMNNQPFVVNLTDAQGQPRRYDIRQNELTELGQQFTERLKKVPSLAFVLNKTRRRTGPNSGFLGPRLFRPEIVDFFSRATLGPQVSGELTLKIDRAMNKTSIPDSATLQAREGTRLNDLLYFIQPQINGVDNPLYRIVPPGTLTSLFAIHVFYAQNPDGRRTGLQAFARDMDTGQVLLNEQGQPQIEARRLTASNEMRQYLADAMERTIRNDAFVISTNAQTADLAAEANQKAQQLIAAINDPNLFVDSRVGVGTPNQKEMFNPNYFLYAHFAKLIPNAKVDSNDDITPERLDALRPTIGEVYAPLLQQSLQAWQQRANNPALSPKARELAQMNIQSLQESIESAPERGVLSDQHDNVRKARAYKVKLQGKDTSQRAKAKRQRSRGGLNVGENITTIGGLPGAVQGQQNSYGGGSLSGSRSGSRM